MRIRFNYASVTATVALCLAIGGPAVAGARSLVTGGDVVDHSLTGVDIASDSITGANIRPGSLGSNAFSAAARANLRGATGDKGDTGATGAGGPAGPPGDAGAVGARGPAGAGIATTTATSPDVTNYQDLSELARVTLSGKGDYVIFTSITVHNTGSADDTLNCGLFSEGNEFGGGGVSIAAGQTLSDRVIAVGAIPVGQSAVDVTLKCQGGGVTTYDLSDISMRLHDLG